MDIPPDTLKSIISLRQKNGLEATEAAVKIDLAGVTKWTLKETPRYRRAGDSPLYLPGKFLTAKGTDPVTGEKDDQATAKAAPKNRPTLGQSSRSSSSGSPRQKIEETQFYRVLHGKGFAVKITQDVLTGEIETKVPPGIEKLDLKFEGIPANGEGIYVTQTSPQIQVSMPLDRFLELAGIKA